MIITGNPEVGLAKSLKKFYPDAEFCSKSGGFDLTKPEGQEAFATRCLSHDQIIVNVALWKFQQTVLLDTVYKACKKAKNDAHIVCVGSTTDRTNKGNSWLYNAEKKALRDYCNSLGLVNVWHSGPKITYVSFGTLSNNQEKHPDRTCLDIDVAAEYIHWVYQQPRHLAINEISIDPVQNTKHRKAETRDSIFGRLKQTIATASKGF